MPKVQQHALFVEASLVDDDDDEKRLISVELECAELELLHNTSGDTTENNIDTGAMQQRIVYDACIVAEEKRIRFTKRSVVGCDGNIG